MTVNLSSVRIGILAGVGGEFGCLLGAPGEQKKWMTPRGQEKARVPLC